MHSSGWLYSKSVFVVFVAVLLGCFWFLSCKMSLSALDTIAYPIDLIPFIMGTVVVVNMAKYTKKKRFAKENHIYNPFPFRSFICFVASIFIPIIFGYGMKSTARAEVKAFLNNDSANVRVYIEGKHIENTDQVITELKKIAPLKHQHTRTIKNINIEITIHGETLRLVLGRDSRNNRKYWIFYPKYNYTSSNDIGRIITNLFDEY